MARYFFNILDGQTPADDAGTELPDLRTAQREATRLCGEILREVSSAFGTASDWRLEVTDDQRNPLFSLRFSIQAHDARPSPLRSVKLQLQ